MKLEAARQALLRRIASSLRHKMTGSLQPIGILTDLILCYVDNKDLVKIQDCAKKLRAQVSAGRATALSVLSWIHDDDNKTVGAKSGIEDCLELIRTDFDARGIRIGMELASNDRVQVRVLREVFICALFVVTDEVRGAKAIKGMVERQADTVMMALQVTDGNAEEFVSSGARLMSWADLEAITRFFGCDMVRNGMITTVSVPIIGIGELQS